MVSVPTFAPSDAPNVWQRKRPFTTITPICCETFDFHELRNQSISRRLAVGRGMSTDIVKRTENVERSCCDDYVTMITICPRRLIASRANEFQFSCLLSISYLTFYVCLFPLCYHRVPSSIMLIVLIVVWLHAQWECVVSETQTRAWVRVTSLRTNH